MRSGLQEFGGTHANLAAEPQPLTLISDAPGLRRVPDMKGCMTGRGDHRYLAVGRRCVIVAPRLALAPVVTATLLEFSWSAGLRGVLRVLSGRRCYLDSPLFQVTVCADGRA